MKSQASKIPAYNQGQTQDLKFAVCGRVPGMLELRYNKGCTWFSPFPRPGGTTITCSIIVRIWNLKKESRHIRVDTTPLHQPTHNNNNNKNGLPNAQNPQNLDDLGLQIQSSRAAPTVVLARSRWWMDGSYIPLGFCEQWICEQQIV